MHRSSLTSKAVLAVAALALFAASCSSSSDSSGSASPDTTVEPATALPAGAQEASLLYDFRAAGGTWTQLSEGSSVYVLELTGVSPTATWFTDRPNRQAGSIPVGTALATIGVSPDDPAPNAVIDVHDAEEGSDVVAVKLEAPAYSAITGTLRFLATPLPTVASESLAAFQERVDASLPASFGPVSLFIDDADTVIGSDGRPVDPAQLGNYEWQYASIVLKGSAPFRVHVKAGPNGHANCVGQATVTDSTFNEVERQNSFVLGFSVNSEGSCWLQTSWQQWAVELEVIEGSNPTGWDTGAKGTSVITFEYHKEHWNVDCGPIPLSGGQSGQAGSVTCVGGRTGLGTITG